MLNGRETIDVSYPDNERSDFLPKLLISPDRCLTMTGVADSLTIISPAMTRATFLLYLAISES